MISYQPIYVEWTLLPQHFEQVTFQQKWDVCFFLLFIITIFLYKTPVFNVNSEDPDQTVCFA